MANEHAKCLKTLGLNISCILSKEGSKTVDKFSTLYNIKHKFLNINETLVKKDLWDAAIVCCKEEFTFSFLEKLTQTKKPLLAEKPISKDPLELEKIIPNKNIIVGFNRRFYSNILYLKSILKNKNIDLVKICLPESNITGFQNNKSLPRLVYSNSIHLFDLLHYLFGNIVWQSSIQSKQKNLLKSASLLGLNKNKINFALDLPLNYPDNFSITVYAGKRRYVLKPLEMLKVYQGMEVHEPSKSVPHRIYKPRLKSSIIANSIGNHKTGLLEQDKSFVKFCISKKSDNRLSNVTDLKAALNSILEIEELLKTK